MDGHGEEKLVNYFENSPSSRKARVTMPSRKYEGWENWEPSHPTQYKVF